MLLLFEGFFHLADLLLDLPGRLFDCALGFQSGIIRQSLEYVEGKAEAGMPQVEHIIDAINVFDIKVVVVVPAFWPSFIEPEPIAAVLKAVIPLDHLGMPHVERVAPTEVGTVTVVRNAAIVAAATVVSNGLWVLLALRLLGALWLGFLCALLRLGFLCALLWLGFLCALLWLGLLFALLRLGFLRALLWLGFLFALLRLGFLRALLRLRFLFVLRLRLVLRRLGFSSALFLLAFLCECRNGGSEKEKQNCCADNSILFHRCCLRLMLHLPLTGYSRHSSYTVCAHGCQFTKAHLLGQKCSSQFMGGNYNLEPVGICRGFDMRLVVQDHAQEAAVNRQPPGQAFVIDKAQLLELIHEMTDPRPSCADHLR